jgi:hypothetical protein
VNNIIISAVMHTCVAQAVISSSLYCPTGEIFCTQSGCASFAAIFRRAQELAPRARWQNFQSSRDTHGFIDSSSSEQRLLQN